MDKDLTFSRYETENEEEKMKDDDSYVIGTLEEEEDAYVVDKLEEEVREG